MWSLASHVLLWTFVVGLGFLLLGALRALALVRWRMEQLEATTPNRLGRSGLKPGKKAPDFTLPSVTGGDLGLHNFAGRSVLLVFTQTGCSPCHQIMPELNRLHDTGDPQVLVVNNGDREVVRTWAEEVEARLPVVVQNQFSLSKRYEVFATPFAFLIDEKGVIRSKGIVNSKEHVGFVLSSRQNEGEDDPVDHELAAAEVGASANPVSHSHVKEFNHA